MRIGIIGTGWIAAKATSWNSWMTFVANGAFAILWTIEFYAYAKV